MKILARPLERALFAHEFENGSEQAVIDALAEFQNDDGGFGHGIEPDIWMPESSPLATTVALQHISALSLPAEHPLVSRAIAYLVAAYDAERFGWSKVSWEVEDAPHAPWWNYSPKLDGPFELADRGNPAAEIVGYLHEYRSLVPGDFLHETTDLGLENFAKLPIEIEMHVLLCYLRMFERMDGDRAEAAHDRLIAAARAVITNDPSAWKSYHAPPTWLAPAPDSLLADDLRSSVEPYLDHLIESQAVDGSWGPFWAWGQQYAHAWEVAKRQWAGHLTLINLRALRAYGRLESS
ncbi:MAG: hypothetical protein QF554_09260 [Dehalococcoidia bacterium]|jgi:hypothetical protein|nr:hypothetical protein [Dehalococcoidia bacterium]